MAAEHETAKEGVQLVLELPSFLNMFGDPHHTPFFGFTVHLWAPVIMSILVASILLAVTYFTTRELKKIPSGMQAFLEIVIEGMDKFFRELMGPISSTFLPFVGSLFLYILLMNYIGLIPLFHSPTASPNTTVALAIIVFFVTHYIGFTRNGFIGYFKHFVDGPIWLAPLMFPVHIIGEFAKPVTLAMRLFGNIMGEDTAIAILVGFGLGALFIPIQFPMQVLALLTSTIQAAVFAILASVYIAGAAGGHAEEH